MFREFDALRAAVDRLATSEYTTAIQGVWTPAFTGFSVAPAGGIYRYIVIGKLCTCFVRMPNAGTSNATTFTLTAPFTAVAIASDSWYAAVLATDNGALIANPGLASISANSNVINLYTGFALAAWTATGNKAAQFTLIFETV